jgi:membrane protease YdiL (CAAX protease family)
MEERRRRLGVVLLAAAFEGGLAGLALLLGWLFQQPPLADCRWNAAALAIGVVATLPMLAVFVTVTRWPVGPLARMRRILDEFIMPLFSGCTLLGLAALSVLAGLGEEMLFRGVLQPVLGRWLGQPGGLLAASALFGLLHPITPTYIVLAAGLGLYLGWLALTTGNLLVVILAHALYDFLVLVYLLHRQRPVR